MPQPARRRSNVLDVLRRDGRTQEHCLARLHRRGGAGAAEQHVAGLIGVDDAHDQCRATGSGLRGIASPGGAQRLQVADLVRVDIANLDRPALLQQVRGHGAAHVANPDHADRGFHDCTRRLDLAIDIRMPRPMPRVTIAVPP